MGREPVLSNRWPLCVEIVSWLDLYTEWSPHHVRASGTKCPQHVEQLVVWTC